jgi:hypothetical protein
MRGIDSPSATNTSNVARRLRRLGLDRDRRMFSGRAAYKEMDPYVDDCWLWKEDVFDYYLSFPPGR